MSELKVAASTFPFLYSHNGLDALKHLSAMGYEDFELLIFPPHCWPRELTADDVARGPNRLGKPEKPWVIKWKMPAA